MSYPPRILIIGAGVVGLSTALYLQRSGRRVTVIDPTPAGGASFGNAGMISADTAAPIVLPGMLGKLPGWLLDRLGPLSVDPVYLPRALPWLLRSMQAGRAARVFAISDAMRALHRDALACWQELLGAERFYALLRVAGQVHVWEGDAVSPSAEFERALRQRHGIASEPLPVEFAGLDAPPNERRAEVLIEHARRMFAKLDATGHSLWMGFRPSTPDSLPIIGAAPGRPGLYLAFGHGHFGMTGGPPSGRLLSRLITGREPELDALPYAPTRFL